LIGDPDKGLLVIDVFELETFVIGGI